MGKQFLLSDCETTRAVWVYECPIYSSICSTEFALKKDIDIFQLPSFDGEQCVYWPYTGACVLAIRGIINRQRKELVFTIGQSD